MSFIDAVILHVNKYNISTPLSSGTVKPIVREEVRTLMSENKQIFSIAPNLSAEINKTIDRMWPS